MIDPLSPDLDLAPFLEVLKDTSILKVLHAARQDVEIFFNLGATPMPLFDTQIAGMAAGFGEQVAYDALVRQMLKIDLDKSSRFTDWARRPLSDNQLTYAIADVTHLAALYPILRERLESEGRMAWVAEEMKAMTDPALYDTSPENAWKRLRPRRHTPKYTAVFKAHRRLARAHGADAGPAARPHPQGRRHRRTGDPGAHRHGGAGAAALAAEGIRRVEVRRGAAGGHRRRRPQSRSPGRGHHARRGPVSTGGTRARWSNC